MDAKLVCRFTLFKGWLELFPLDDVVSLDNGAPIAGGVFTVKKHDKPLIYGCLSL